jgi:eukaryotic-like serine/threonine-protein kinase
LRSDCIRESPEGEAGVEARRRDVHDLAAVLMQVLVGATHGSFDPAYSQLPAPFAEIARNGADGSWGLAEIKAALGRRDPPKAEPQKAPPPIRASANAVPPERHSTPMAASDRAGDFAAKPFWSDEHAPPGPQNEQSASSVAESAMHAGLPPQKTAPTEFPALFGTSQSNLRSWLTAAVLLLGVVFVGWLCLHFWFGRRTAADALPVPAPSASTAPPAASFSHAITAPRSGSQPRVEWHVVAFTYDRQDQARKKASSLARRYPTLSPTVFSPNGKSPWLVTVGGVLERDAAYALARKAPGLGLPRDTYAQNFTIR